MIWLILLGLFVVGITIYTIVSYMDHKDMKFQADQNKKEIEDSKLAIAFQFSNVARVKTIVELHPEFFMNHYMVGAGVKDLINEDELDTIKIYFQKIILVDNRGLDFGGFFEAADKIPDRFTHVMKIHDKKDLNWLKRLINPLIEADEKTVLRNHLVTSGKQVHPYRPDLNINIYWPHVICNSLRLPMPLNFTAGGMFIAPLQKIKNFKQELIDHDLYKLNDETTYDPGWVSYYYKYVARDSSFVEPSYEETIQNPELFKQKMIAMKCPFNNGHHYALKTGDLFTDSGWAARDSMFEHGIERVIGTYCANK